MFTNRANQDSPRNGSRANNGATESTKDAFVAAFSRLDVPATIRKYPFPAVAIASGVGALVGLTVGSRLVRVLIGSVGMYTMSEVLRRYAKKALDDIKITELGEDVPAPPH